MGKQFNILKECFTPEQLAKRWGVSVGSLANKRSNGSGPKYIKFFQKIYYNKKDIYEYERKKIEKQ